MMLPDAHYAELKELFERAMELAPDQRAAFARAETEGRAELGLALLRLLDAAAEPPSADSDEFPQLPEFERYELGAIVGEGGGGVVFEAWQRQPRRKVAMKILRSPGTVSKQRFVQEIEILGQLSHPGIVQIIEGGVTDGGLSFYVCELVPEARTITAYAKEEVLGLEQRLELFAQACAAVAHAHHHGVLHLDLKPANVLVDRDGRVRVIDFGIAKLSAEAGRLPARSGKRSTAAPSAGSLASMAPEQAGEHAESVGFAADVYALGLLLFELVAGEPARRLDGLDLAAALHVVREGSLPRVAERASDLPPSVRRAMEAATTVDRQARITSPIELSRLALGLDRVASRPPRPGAWTVAGAAAALVVFTMSFAEFFMVARPFPAAVDGAASSANSDDATDELPDAVAESAVERTKRKPLRNRDTTGPSRRYPGSRVSTERVRSLTIENQIADARSSDRFDALAAQTAQRWNERSTKDGPLARSHHQTDYAILCFVEGREDEALRLARSALELPHVPALRQETLRVVILWLLLRHGERVEARALAEELLASEGANKLLEETVTQAAIALGVLRGQEGELEAGRAMATEGLKTLESLLSPRDPRLDWARDALALLDQKR